MLNNKKCETIDEKIRIENKTLKTIIKNCLEVIEKCMCINRSIVLDKKHINVLINGYNEWLSQNQDLGDFDDNKDIFDDIFEDNYNFNEELIVNTEELIEDLEEDSNQDLDYNPMNKQKPKSLFMSRDLKSVNNLIIASNLVKKKYKKHKTVSNYKFICDYPECDRQFKSSYNLKQHHDKHANVSRYKCLWPGMFSSIDTNFI